jgi:hypothetical protein
MSLRKIKTLEHGITIHRNAGIGEYEVRVKGNPAATYFTDDKADAMSTAQYMCSEAGALVKGRQDRAELLSTPITNEHGAANFLTALFMMGLLFHLDRNPQDVADTKTGAPVFTDDEVVLLTMRIDELNLHSPNPYNFCTEDDCWHTAELHHNLQKGTDWCYSTTHTNAQKGTD